MKYKVYLVENAELDILEMYSYVAENDSVEAADRLLDNIEKTIMKLESLPERGHFPPELERIGVLEYREIFYRPYRIIYHIIKSEVSVHCVLDGRRDLQDILQRRVLRI